MRYFFSLSLQPFFVGLRFPRCGPRLPAAVSLSAGRCCGIDGQERDALRIGKHGAFGSSLHDLLIVGREVQFGVFETFGARSLAFESRRREEQAERRVQEFDRMASGVLLHDDRFELPHVGGIGGDEAEAAVPASP